MIPREFDFKKWRKAFEAVLNGQKINTPKREIIAEMLDEKTIASKWIDIFEEIIKYKEIKQTNLHQQYEVNKKNI